MAKSKTTMKDIAKACGVSLATVSYVINNSEKEVIRHETRIKVLEMAEKLNYIPNRCRESAHVRSNLVGIIINWNKRNAPSKKLIYYDLAVELQRCLSELGFDTILATTETFEEDADIISKRSLDAVFIIDISTPKVRQVTNKYYVPIIFLDCEINGALFYKVYPNYPVVIGEAKRMLGEPSPFLIMEDILNDELKDLITSHFRSEDVFINSPDNDLKSFLKAHKHQKGIVLGEILGLEVERYIPNDQLVVITAIENSRLLLPDTKTIAMSNRTKAKAAVNIMQRLLRLEFDCYPGNKLLLNP